MVAKKIMIAGGCSYTDQDYKTSNKDRDQTPGLWPMWPEHLGKKLDLEVVNTAKCGAGNEPCLCLLSLSNSCELMQLLESSHVFDQFTAIGKLLGKVKTEFFVGVGTCACF